jgi:hypothetical protein
MPYKNYNSSFLKLQTTFKTEEDYVNRGNHLSQFNMTFDAAR